jgi:hypothetical protein
MTRKSNRAEANRHGIRRRVVTIDPNPNDPLAYFVSLECGHATECRGLPHPKRLRCPVCRDEPWPPLPMIAEVNRRDIWVTKWSLKDGVIRKMPDATIGSIRAGAHDHVQCAVVRVGAIVHRFFRNEWHESLDEAVKHIEEVRAKALMSLARHADFLASLEFRPR